MSRADLMLKLKLLSTPLGGVNVMSSSTEDDPGTVWNPLEGYGRSRTGVNFLQCVSIFFAENSSFF